MTVFESLPEAGGMLRYGIPEYRLPREVLESEIRDIEDVGRRHQDRRPGRVDRRASRRGLRRRSGGDRCPQGTEAPHTRREQRGRADKHRVPARREPRRTTWPWARRSSCWAAATSPSTAPGWRGGSARKRCSWPVSNAERRCRPAPTRSSRARTRASSSTPRTPPRASWTATGRVAGVEFLDVGSLLLRRGRRTADRGRRRLRPRGRGRHGHLRHRPASGHARGLRRRHDRPRSHRARPVHPGHQPGGSVRRRRRGLRHRFGDQGHRLRAEGRRRGGQVPRAAAAGSTRSWLPQVEPGACAWARAKASPALSRRGGDLSLPEERLGSFCEVVEGMEEGRRAAGVGALSAVRPEAEDQAGGSSGGTTESSLGDAADNLRRKG